MFMDVYAEGGNSANAKTGKVGKGQKEGMIARIRGGVRNVASRVSGTVQRLANRTGRQ